MHGKDTKRSMSRSGMKSAEEDKEEEQDTTSFKGLPNLYRCKVIQYKLPTHYDRYFAYL